MAEDKPFPKGINWSNPHPNAPAFIKGQISFKVDEFKQYLDENKTDGWVNIDLKESKKGNLYLALNDYKKEKAQTTNQDEVSTDDIPVVDEANEAAMLASQEEKDNRI